jgi:hypothetical protein
MTTATNRKYVADYGPLEEYYKENLIIFLMGLSRLFFYGYDILLLSLTLPSGVTAMIFY